MNTARYTLIGIVCVAVAACTAPQRVDDSETLRTLEQVPADIEDIYVADSLERAAESYRRYLEETARSGMTPEAMRRLADLQIEQAYGVMGSGEIVEMAAPERVAGRAAPDMVAPDTTASTGQVMAHESSRAAPTATESDAEFESRATQREALLATSPDDGSLAGDAGMDIPAGPKEAIAMYWQILETYPNYERNDQVLYQLSRAYDEIGDPDKAMEVMDRFVAQYPYSDYLDEVYFRRGEYWFVRKRYLDAEESYGAIIRMGASSNYYELALYKQGWALYKQEMYEESLHRYMAMLDHRLAIGFDFDSEYDADDEHRLADTFRVISLGFSNLGGPEVVDEYFATNGHRVYADKIYGNLAEFYFEKLRYEDSASVYKSFVNLNPYHKVSPFFSMRVVDIYAEAGFPRLVVDAKKDFASRYALEAEYWHYFDTAESPEVIGFLKQNLTDLAGHYHALYQEELLEEERPENYREASKWYSQFLASFPADEESPQINYQLADLLLENEDFGRAATEYERTAYNYEGHEKASAAGYAAVYAHRENLERATDAELLEIKQLTVDSSLRFADTFQAHDQAAVVLGAAADDLYDMQDLPLAIESAHKLIDRYPDADPLLVRSAWAVIANSSIDLAAYPDAEHAYSQVLALTPADDDTRTAVIDGLAAAIYKQGEQANQAEDYQGAAAHFLRIKALAPTSAIRSSAEYDAAAALIKVQDWAFASSVLEEFRTSHPDHELNSDATKQLAFIYLEDGQTERAALEHERIAAEATDPELGREALLTAGELYDEANVLNEAIRVYESYVSSYPRPLNLAMETRTRLSEIFKQEQQLERYYEELGEIVALHGDAGRDRTDRSRYLAGKAALVLAELTFDAFAEVQLVQPFDVSLAEKQHRMDTALAAFGDLTDYQMSEVTAAATYYIAEIYLDFSNALLTSERPAGLSSAELSDYDLVIEEEAYPFEEQSIDVHEKNFELLVSGIHNPWVQKSLDRLVALMPGQYARNEISGGYLKSVDSYAYRMPNAPPPGSPLDENGENPVAVMSQAE